MVLHNKINEMDSNSSTSHLPSWSRELFGENISGWIGSDLKEKHTVQETHYPLVVHTSPISQLIKSSGSSVVTIKFGRN